MADEVRKLAEKTDMIQASVAGVVKSMQGTTASVKSASEQIDSLMSSLSAITDSTQN